MTSITAHDRAVNQRVANPSRRERIEQNADSLRIIHALNGSETNGMCRCPAHEDDHPSLHVSASGDGKVLVKCFARCSQDAVIAALKSRRLWPESRNQQRPRPSEPRPTTEQPENSQRQDNEKERIAFARTIIRAAGDNDDLTVVRRYFHARGLTTIPPGALMLTAAQSSALGLRRHFPAVVLPIVHRDPHQFKLAAHVIHLSKDGRHKLAVAKPKKSYGVVKGGYAVVNRLDHLNPRLLVGEGVENTTGVSEIIGADWPAIAAVSATNLPSLILPPWSREIIIAADHDPAGLAAAREAARLWARSDRIIRIAFPGDEGDDWNDVVREARDAAELAWWREAILNIEPEPIPQAPEVRALGMEQFMQLQFPPRRFLLRPWLTTTGLTMIDAPPGHGKTWLALSIAYAVAAGQALMDWEVETSARVLYVDGELPGELFQTRLRLLGAALPESQFRVLSRAQFEMAGATMLDLGTEDGRDYLDQVIEHDQITLIILDSVSTLVRSGIDNDVESWRAIQDWSLHHRARGRAVIYLHHHGRSGQPRGTSAREIVLDARIKLTRDDSLSSEEKKTTAFKLEFAKAREFFGADAAARIAYLSTRSGAVEWKYETMKDSNRQRVADLMQRDMAAADIARELGVTKGRVSQIMSELRDQRARRSSV
jgi:putative DNA primase/helicase